jgi:hypothetical protein
MTTPTKGDPMNKRSWTKRKVIAAAGLALGLAVVTPAAIALAQGDGPKNEPEFVPRIGQRVAINYDGNGSIGYVDSAIFFRYDLGTDDPNDMEPHMLVYDAEGNQIATVTDEAGVIPYGQPVPENIPKPWVTPR